LDDVVLLTLVIALVFGAIGVSSPLMTLYLQSLGANYGQIALIMASTAGVGLACSYAWGRVSDALGRRKPLIAAGLCCTAAAYLVLSQVASPALAWLARVGEAASMAAYSTASLALMGDLLAARGRRGQRMGIYRGIGSLAFALGAVAGGRLADLDSLRATFLLCTALYLGAGLVALALHEIPAARPGKREPTPSSEPIAVLQGESLLPTPLTRLSWAHGRVIARRTHWKPGLPVLFLCGAFLFTTAWQAQASMWPNFMASLGYSKTAISSLWGLAAVVEAPSMWLAGQWSDVVGRAALLSAGGLSAAIVILSYALLSRLLPALAGIQFVRGLSFGSFTANAMTYAVESGDNHSRGRNSGLYNMVNGAGQLAGLLLGGTLAQAGGFAVMFVVCAGAALLGGLCFLALQKGLLITFRQDVSP
jgi:MFS family permease